MDLVFNLHEFGEGFSHEVFASGVSFSADVVGNFDKLVGFKVREDERDDYGFHVFERDFGFNCFCDLGTFG